MGKYVQTAILIAIITHVLLLFAAPRVLMHKAMERLGAAGENAWHSGERVTAQSRQIVRPSPDFAYASCVYDLSHGPVRITVTPWPSYWSLSLYGANSDNFYVVDDREARRGAAVLLVRTGSRHPETDDTVVESPSGRGIALIRRLAPSPETHAGAVAAARTDICAPS